MKAAEIARATPAGRDRYVDFLRVLSLGLVVVGHWLATLVWWEEGTVRGENGLNVLPEMWPLTWLFQVMPLFFFVGGFSNSLGWDSVQRAGEVRLTIAEPKRGADRRHGRHWPAGGQDE